MDYGELSLISMRQIEKLRSERSTVPTDMAYLCGYREGSSGGVCRFYTSDSRDGAPVFSDGYSSWSILKGGTGVAIRPSLKLSPELFEQLSSQMTIGADGVRKVNYGEYPQQVASPYMQKFMEKELTSGTLRKIGSYYGIGCYIYECFGKRYIRVLSKAESLTLSNGFVCKRNDPVWVEISPVSWLVDEDTKILVAKKGLLAGVLFDDKKYNGNFESTLMKEYLDEQMSRDLFQKYNRELDDKAEIVNGKLAQILEFFSSHVGMLLELDDLYHLLDKYNSEINKLYKTSTVSKLYDEFLAELEKFLVEMEEKYNQYNEYYKMLDYVMKCLNVLDKKYSFGSGEIDELLLYINGFVISDYDNNESIVILNKFKVILNNFEKDICSYLGGDMNSPITKYKNFDELKKDIGKIFDSISGLNKNYIGIRLLSSEQLCGKKQLSVLKKYGSRTIVTDLAIKMGAHNIYAPDMSANVGIVATSSTVTNHYDDLEDVVVGVEGASFSCLRTDIVGVRPAFVANSLFSTLFAKSVSRHGLVDEVELGEYPQFAPKGRIQKVLENKLKKDLLKKTGRSYTLCKYYYSDSKYRVYPKVHDEYEYEGKKYIRVEDGNSVLWIEVSPVIWLIDEETKTFISKYSLFSGVPFGHIDNIRNMQLEIFINKYMARDIFQSTDYNRENVNYASNEKTYRISLIVEDIRGALASYHGSEDIMGKVQSLINKYNSDVDNAYDTTASPFGLTMEVVNVDFLYAKLISDLEDLLGEVKKYSKKYVEYTKMLELTKKCLSVLEGQDVLDDEDDLVTDIVTIKKVILPFLGDDSVGINIKNIFLEGEKEIGEYLRGNEESKIKEYKTLEEYKLGVRRKMHTLLLDLNNSVRNRDIVNEIKSGYLKTMDGLFVKSKDNYVNSFLSEIKELIGIINERGNDADKKRMQVILSNRQEIGNDLTEALKVVVNLYKELYMIILDIDERDKKNLEHSHDRIDVGEIIFNK